MQAVILAGGKGTRLSQYTKEIPKPMISIKGKPILLHQIHCFKEYGIKDFIIIIGYLGEIIKEYFGDGKQFGVSITYIEEEQPLGTAGAFFYLKKMIEKDFFVTYGDIMFDIDLQKFYHFHINKQSQGTLFLHPNSHPYDSDLVEIDSNHRVIKIDTNKNNREYYYRNLVNSGMFIFNNSVLSYFVQPKKTDLEKDFLSHIIELEDLYGYVSPEYVKDMGTPARLAEVTKHYEDGIIESKNLGNKQKCIFLDRDGTLNKYVGLLYNKDQFELENNNIANAIRLINESNFLCILITNQPVVARNLCTIDELNEIHKKMETILGNEGAYLNDIVFCPHHPDKGYPEENPEYKIVCNCRKPNIGMIEYCANKYNIDLNNCYFIGDTTIDIQTGINCCVKTVLVQTGLAGNDKTFDVKADIEALDLYDAIKIILRR